MEVSGGLTCCGRQSFALPPTLAVHQGAPGMTLTEGTSSPESGSPHLGKAHLEEPLQPDGERRLGEHTSACRVCVWRGGSATEGDGEARDDTFYGWQDRGRRRGRGRYILRAPRPRETERARTIRSNGHGRYVLRAARPSGDGRGRGRYVLRAARPRETDEGADGTSYGLHDRGRRRGRGRYVPRVESTLWNVGTEARKQPSREQQ